MARRVARSNTVIAAPKTARNKNKKRSLNAYAQAQKLVPEKGIAKHRLGEDLDDEPRHKKRRVGEDDEDEEEVEEDNQSKRPTKRRIADQGNEVEYGSDSDGNEWTMGGIADGNEESDLDSDEAFGESDEERFEGFTFRGSSGKKSRAKKQKRKLANKHVGKDVDLDEVERPEDDSGDSEDDEGLGLGDDAVDLAAMLDDNDEELFDKRSQDVDQSSGSDDDDDDDDASGVDSDSMYDSEDDDDDDDDMDEEAIARNRDRIEALSAPSKTRSLAAQSAAVTLEDFAEGVGLAPERSTSKKKQNKVTALAAPLPRRQQDRLDREVASEKAKAQLEKWLPGTKEIRRAEHLSFPLQHPDDQGVTLGKEKFVPSAESAPQNELEESIQRIMEESGLAAKRAHPDSEALGDEESALLKAEELAVKDMPVEEVMRRRAELRRARELLFREEVKSKRLAKIKSKSHRRVMRRQKERERQAMEALGEDYIDEDDKERADRKRAEARMSTKHKDSKWSKALKQTNRTAWDDDAKNEAVEQARRNEELRKRIEGKEVEDEEGDDISSDDLDHDNETLLKSLEQRDGLELKPKKGLAALKFMQASDERRRKANDEDVERLRKELAIADGDEDESETEGEENLGRAIFGPASKQARAASTKQARLEFEAPDDSEEDPEDGSIDTAQQPRSQAKTQATTKNSVKNATLPNQPLSNDLLKTAESSVKKSSPNGWLKAPKGAPKEDNISTSLNSGSDTMVKDVSKAERASSNTSNEKKGDKIATLNMDSGSDIEEDLANPIVNNKHEKQTLQQRAFAGDDVEAVFETEKADLAASEDEKEVSNHIPGWGSWTGDGLSRSIRKANERAKHNPLFKTKVDGVRQADRKDASLKNVIISEKQDRKGKKYLAPVLPHEFETKEQYERSRRVPMGPEWTTKEVHQRMTKPRVVVKKGVNIKPLERPIA